MYKQIIWRLAQGAPLALLVGLVLIFGVGPTAWANHAQQGTVPRRGADLMIMNSARWSGGNLHFILRISNMGPTAARNVVVDNRVTSQLRIRGITTSQGRCVSSTQHVACRLGDLRVNGSVSIIIRTRPIDRKPREYRNTATVNSSTNDPNRSNNSSTATVGPRRADVALRQGGIWLNSNLRFTVRVSNVGPIAATGVVVTDDVPSQLRIESISTPSGRCRVSGQQVTCQWSTIPVNRSVFVTIRARPATSQVLEVTNTASVRIASQESNTSNNTASITLRPR